MRSRADKAPLACKASSFEEGTLFLIRYRFSRRRSISSGLMAMILFVSLSEGL